MHQGRVTGAGFGGCAVALVAGDHASTFTGTVARDYQHQTALAPGLCVTAAADGTEVQRFR